MRFFCCQALVDTTRRLKFVVKLYPSTPHALNPITSNSIVTGTWGMKKEYYELAKEGAQKLLDEMGTGSPDVYSSDCLIAKLQIEEGTGHSVVHPIEILWKAYGGD